MAKVTMLTMAGAEAGTIELNDAIFGIEPNEYAVQAIIKNYLANQRQGTQSAKTRGDVRGGGRKPFRQKGTGRHRQGSTTDPSQVGGGVARHQPFGEQRLVKQDVRHVIKMLWRSLHFLNQRVRGVDFQYGFHLGQRLPRLSQNARHLQAQIVVFHDQTGG